MIDGFIQARGFDAPLDELSILRDGYEQPIIEELDLQAAGITSVIWATGYAFDYRLVKAPVHDKDGFPIQNRGVTEHAGLSFVGMPWMPSLKSGILPGVGEAAEHIAAVIVHGRAGDGATDGRLLVAPTAA